MPESSGDFEIIIERTKTLDSLSHIKIIGIEETLDSDAYILEVQEEQLDSDSHILDIQEETLNSDSNIKATNELTIDSDAHIKKIDITVTLDSDSHIKKLANEVTIDSDAVIYKSGNKTLDSDAYIKQTYDETIDSDSVVELEYRQARTDVTEIAEVTLASINFTPTRNAILYSFTLKCKSLTGTPSVKLTVNGIDTDDVVVSSEGYYLFTLDSQIFVQSGTETTITVTATIGRAHV